MIYIDTGAFLARFVERDQNHATARAAWQELEESGESCATSNFVVDEFLTLLARRTDYRFAAARGRELMASARLNILRPSDRDEAVAIDVLEKYADQQVSFTDCISFVLMKAHRVKRAFTFDRHFAFAGFRAWPTMKNGRR